MVSNYQNKSELYLDAADVLMHSQSGQYAVVPHTVYYSCLLLMEHKCYVVDKKTELDIRPIINGKQIDLHVGLTNYIKGKLEKSNNYNAYKRMQDFTSKIRDLKMLRVKADYKNERVSLDDSKKSFELANEIISILKTC